MIVFYKRKAKNVVLASIVKHYNPDTTTCEYEDNKEVLEKAKMMNTYNFIRVKDYEQAILNKYESPKWINNSYKNDFIKHLLCHKNTNSNELIGFLSKKLFTPEEIFDACTEKVITYREKVKQVKKEILVFEQNSEKRVRKGIMIIEVNSEHDIGRIMCEDMIKEYNIPLIVLHYDKAFVGNAEQLGFRQKIVQTNRYDALRMKKEILIEKPVPQKIVRTRNTTLLQY